MQPENGSPLFTVTYSILAHIILKIVFAVFIRLDGICARAGLALGAVSVKASNADQVFPSGVIMNG